MDNSFESLNYKQSLFSNTPTTIVKNSTIVKKDSSEIVKLKQENSRLKEIIQNLELQCQLNGIVPVSQGGELKKSSKTEEKIQEIEV